MYQRHFILVLCLTILGGSIAAKYENERTARNLPDLPADNGIIDIDDDRQQTQPYQEGSAYSEMDDEDGYNSGDDSDDYDASGDRPTGPVIKQIEDTGNGVDTKDNNEKNDPVIDPDEPTDRNTDNPGDDMGESGPNSEPVSSTATIFGHPGILAGIIGGAVVGLLCAVLLVMFIVYRMRKKDEGSYALDEPKRSPSHSYTRAPTKEFYA